jgi:dephospho-CoA kinase
MIIIGVTGIMGSGKTLVSKMFGALGAEVINADKLVHNLLERRAISKKIAESFGKEVLNEKSEVDRKKLGRRVFLKTQDRVNDLNKIIHPEVMKLIQKNISDAKKRGVPAVVIDAPLLIETGLHERTDYNVCVRLSPESAAKRLSLAGRASRDEFKARMRFQMDGDEKEEKADFVIDNRGTVEETKSQVRKIWGIINGG